MPCNLRGTTIVVLVALLIAASTVFVYSSPTITTVSYLHTYSYVDKADSVDPDDAIKDTFEFGVPSVAQILRTTPHSIELGQASFDDIEDVSTSMSQDSQSVLD